MKNKKRYACALLPIAAVCMNQGIAQESIESGAVVGEPLEELIVYGSAYQKALADALKEKRNADSVLDSVSAEDIGKLPDISIGETIARLPGIVVNRDRGNATEISVRGLGSNLSNTLLNGREVATGESSRSIRYETYPAELLNGAYVFKSPKASLVEGGVGGTIDLRTIKPLDVGERKIVVNGRLSHSDLGGGIDDADSSGVTGSVSYVDQFLDDTLGVAIGYSYREQPIATARTNIFPSTDRSEFGNANTAAFDSAGVERVPFGFEALVRGGDDERQGAVAAIQWKPTSSLEINADIFHSSVDFIEEQRGFRVEGLENEFGNTFANVRAEDGFITAGTITQTAGFGQSISTVNEEFTLFDDSYAGGLNIKWAEGPLSISGDIAYSKNERENQFLSVETEVHDVSGVPFQITNGLESSFSTNANGLSSFGFNVDLSDPSINLLSEVKVPTSDIIVDEINSYAIDVGYEINDSFFTSLNAGVKYTDREKSLFARSDFLFIAESERVAVPDALLSAALTGAGSVNFSPTLTFDRDAVIDQVFGGVDPQQAAFNQVESWVVEESISAYYLSASFEGEVANLPYSGNIGVRVADTSLTSLSTRQLNDSNQNVFVPFSVENDFTDVLPSLNVSFFPAEEHIVRLGLSEAIARPPLDDLSAGVGEFDFGRPEAFGGNPNLSPFRANQLDVSYEWYFSEDAAFTIAGFYKDIETFIVRLTNENTILPSGVIGSFTQPVNGEGGSIKGVEVSLTQPFNFLSGPLKDFGVSLNYTYVDSEIEVDPAFVAGGSYPLPGLAENSFNAQLWYYKNGLEGRIGYRYRDEFATELGDVPDQVLFNDSESVVDFQLSYKFDEDSSLDGLTVLFQANNLTNEPFQTFYASDNARGRFEEFGRRYWLGFSYAL